MAAEITERRHRSFGSRQPVLFGSLSSPAHATSLNLQHEQARKATATIMPLWKARTTASRSKPFTASGYKHETLPNTMSSSTSKCITIANGFIRNWDTYPLKPLNLNKSLSNLSVNRRQDQTAWCAAFVNWCLAASGCDITGSALSGSFLKI